MHRGRQTQAAAGTKRAELASARQIARTVRHFACQTSSLPSDRRLTYSAIPRFARGSTRRLLAVPGLCIGCSERRRVVYRERATGPDHRFRPKPARTKSTKEEVFGRFGPEI